MKIAMHRGVLLAALPLLLAGCATVTPYQPRGYTGGYQERQVGENRYYVEFFGNGKTSRDTVMVYWLHRCAELTVQKGFDYFLLVAKTPESTSRAQPDGDALLPAGGDEGADSGGRDSIVRLRGGGGYVPIYVPGGTITTWSSRGVIEMRRGEPRDERYPAFTASLLLKKLGPLVQQAMQSGTNVTFPRSVAASAEPRGASSQAGASDVKLDDLDGLLPKD